jgi:hypothetical protein
MSLDVSVLSSCFFFVLCYCVFCLYHDFFWVLYSFYMFFIRLLANSYSLSRVWLNLAMEHILTSGSLVHGSLSGFRPIPICCNVMSRARSYPWTEGVITSWTILFQQWNLFLYLLSWYLSLPGTLANPCLLRTYFSIRGLCLTNSWTNMILNPLIEKYVLNKQGLARVPGKDRHNK